MKASDLSYDVKQEVLGSIRDQVGSSQYNGMIDAVGEDGLIDHALEKASEMAASQSPAKKRGFGAALGG